MSRRDEDGDLAGKPAVSPETGIRTGALARPKSLTGEVEGLARHKVFQVGWVELSPHPRLRGFGPHQQEASSSYDHMCSQLPARLSHLTPCQCLVG